jgi:hypothetical protein
MGIIDDWELPRHSEHLLHELRVLLIEKLLVKDEIVAVMLHLALLVLRLLQLLALALEVDRVALVR